MKKLGLVLLLSSCALEPAEPADASVTPQSDRPGAPFGRPWVPGFPVPEGGTAWLIRYRKD